MNPQQRKFLSAYLRDGDKIAAYREAYPKAKESSIKNAANRLLQHPGISETVRQKMKQLEDEDMAACRSRIMDRMRALEILTSIAEGEETREKEWRMAGGNFETRHVKPTIAQSLTAIGQLSRFEGWYAQKASTVTPKPKAEKQLPGENEKVSFRIMMDGLPIDDWDEVYDEVSAYYDKEDTPFADPDNNHLHDRFMEVQKRREQRRDAERAARMTAALNAEEQQALSAFSIRPVEEDHYQPHKKVIQDLVKKYLETKDAQVLKECQAVKILCGLRFLHHRHRYEAENAAGWEFHPFNNHMIRKKASSAPQGGTQKLTPPLRLTNETISATVGGGREGLDQGRLPAVAGHSEHSEESPGVTGEVQSMFAQNSNPGKSFNPVNPGSDPLLSTSQRQQTTTTPIATGTNHKSQITDQQSNKAAAREAIKTGKLPPDIDLWELLLQLDPNYYARYENMIDIKEKLFRALPRKTQWGIMASSWNALHGRMLQRDKNGRVTW